MRTPTTRRSRRAGGVTFAAIVLCLSTTGCVLAAAGAVLGTGAGAAKGVATSPDSDAKTADGIPVGAAIKVTLAPSRDVPVVKVGTADTIWLRGAERLIGRVDAIRRDTIHLAVTEAHLRNGQMEKFGRTHVVTAIHRQPDAAIQLLSRRPFIAENTLIGAGLGLIAGVIAVIVICSGGGCFG